ncbi:MAG: hypothetical protein ACYTFI_20725, partial [Planctomycetota bacterium]
NGYLGSFPNNPDYFVAFHQCIKELGVAKTTYNFVPLCDLALSGMLSAYSSHSERRVSWEDVHPGWRFVALLDAAKDIPPFDWGNPEGDYRRFVRDVYSIVGRGWLAPWEIAGEIRQDLEERLRIGADSPPAELCRAELLLCGLRIDKPWVFAAPWRFARDIAETCPAPFVLAARGPGQERILYIMREKGKSEEPSSIMQHLTMIAFAAQAIGLQGNRRPAGRLLCHHEWFGFRDPTGALGSCTSCEFDKMLQGTFGLSRDDLDVRA